MRLLAQTESTQPLVWQLETDWPWSPWFTVLFVVATVLVIGYLYARESSPAGAAYRTLLASLRLTTIGLVLVMLSELLFSTTRSGLPRLVVLVDHSASMGLEQPAATASSTVSDRVAPESRLEAARELFLANNAELIAQWQKHYNVEFTAVADGTVQLEGKTSEEMAEALQELGVDTARSAYSRLGDALATAVDPRQGLPPAAVVLATDGRTTAGRSLDEARQLARERGVPVYTVGYGATTAPPDLRLVNLTADRAAFVGDLVALGVTLEATGNDGQVATVRVRDTSNDKVIVEQNVDITGTPLAEQLQLVVQPDRPGTITYAIEVDNMAEERDTTNNRLQHTLEVRDEQVHVLLAAGYPNYEFRYLKNLLDRDSSFALESYLQEADVDYAQQDATAIAQLPMEADGLDEVDVVLMIDLNPRLMPPRWWQNVERHVVEQGGGLVLVAGPRYFPWQYNTTPTIALLSPVVLSSAGRRGGVYDPGYLLELTALGRETAAMQLAPTAANSEAVWQGLPPFYWYAAADELKPAARSLATHPAARTSSGAAVPLIATHYVGRGRVLYHGVDSTWRWRLRVGDVFFARYWGQSLRHLARSKMLDESGAAEIVVERDQYDLGQPVRLTLRTGGHSIAEDGNVELLLTAPGQANRRVALTPSPAGPRELHATLSDLPPGDYRVTAAGAGLEAPPDAIEFSVVAPPGELADVTMNKLGLEQLAVATYGKFYTAQNASDLKGDLPTGDRVPLEVLPPVELWNQWWMLAAITACLTSEWILRKRRAML
jgi:hypothetical protein